MQIKKNPPIFIFLSFSRSFSSLHLFTSGFMVRPLVTDFHHSSLHSTFCCSASFPMFPSLAPFSSFFCFLTSLISFYFWHFTSSALRVLHSHFPFITAPLPSSPLPSFFPSLFLSFFHVSTFFHLAHSAFTFLSSVMCFRIATETTAASLSPLSCSVFCSIVSLFVCLLSLSHTLSVYVERPRLRPLNTHS